MTFEVKELPTPQRRRVALRFWEEDGRGGRRKRGVIIELDPTQMPVVPEMSEYPIICLDPILRTET